MDRNRSCMLSKENLNIQQSEYQLRHRYVFSKDFFETHRQKATNDIINTAYGIVNSNADSEDENVLIKI